MSANNSQTIESKKYTKDFAEVVCGINKKKAIEHAKLLFETKGLPLGRPSLLGVDFYAFLRELASGNLAEASAILRKDNCLPTVTGRFGEEPFAEFNVADSQGQFVSYRALERFVGDTVVKFPPLENRSKNKSVAVIGAGVSGLTAAGELAYRGYKVDVFDKEPLPGGVLRYGIPAFRYPKNFLENEIAYLKACHVNFHSHCLVGRTITFDELRTKYDVVYLSTGAGIAKSSGIDGETLPGVYMADDFLSRINRWQSFNDPKIALPLVLGENVIVIGSGNAACDVARVCARLKCKVTVITRKSEREMNVRRQIVAQLKDEGVRIENLLNVVKILKNGSFGVSGVRVKRFDYVELGNDEWELREVEGSSYEINTDNVIIAIGHDPNVRLNFADAQIRVNADGTVWTRKNSSKTSVDKVYVGGNVSDGAGPCLWAMMSAKEAVREIDEDLN